MRTKLFSLVIVLFAACAVSCSSEQVSVEKDNTHTMDTFHSRYRSRSEVATIARESLERFYPSTKGEDRNNEISSIIPYVSTSTKGTATDTLFYIVNYGEDEGFALISASPVVSPLLVITEGGHYEGELTDNNGFNIYMESLISQLSISSLGRYDPVQQPDIVDTIRAHTSEVVTPMLQSAWHQGSPFGDLAPNYLAGCAAVALGQVMAYYEHPDTLHLTYPNGSGVLNLDWSSMISHDSGNASDCNVCMKNAQLMRELGERLSMVYSQESLTTVYNVYSLLPSLGYTSGMYSNYSRDGLRYSLMQNYPSLIAASYSYDLNKGHMWVVDGYQYDDWSYDYYYFRGFNLDGSVNMQFAAHDERTTYYFHFNLGRGTSYNGYYVAYDYANQYGDLFPVNQPNTTLVSIFTEIYDILPHADVLYIPSVRLAQ